MLVGKRIVITGGAGFLGTHITKILAESNDVFVPRSKDYDLKSSDAVKQIFTDFPNTDIVIHAAADIGGIGYSSTHPADQFYNNTLINLNIVHQSFKAGIKKFVGVGSVCEYPADAQVPFKEESLWDGYPVITNDAYGLTKRMLLAQCTAYNKQHNFQFIHLLPVNLYGPGDDFDTNNSHVIPAIIKKVVYAMDHGEEVVEIWGTGNESREFVYVEDAAEAVVFASEKYEKPYPVNIGSGAEIIIRNLANTIGSILQFKGNFVYLNNGLGGQHRRLLDVSKAKEEFGFIAKTSLHDGLVKTIEYYIDNKHNLG